MDCFNRSPEYHWQWYAPGMIPKTHMPSVICSRIMHFWSVGFLSWNIFNDKNSFFFWKNNDLKKTFTQNIFFFNFFFYVDYAKVSYPLYFFGAIWGQESCFSSQNLKKHVKNWDIRHFTIFIIFTKKWIKNVEKIKWPVIKWI